MKKACLCLLLLLYALGAMAQMPNYYVYHKWVLDDGPYKFSFMDVAPTDTVVVTHRCGFSGPYINDTIVGNYVMITPTSYYETYSELEDWMVTSVNGQMPLCSERLWLTFVPIPQPEVNVTDDLCLHISDSLGWDNRVITIVETSSDSIVGRYNYEYTYPFQVCELPSGTYTVAFYYKFDNYFDYRKTLSVTIP